MLQSASPLEVPNSTAPSPHYIYLLIGFLNPSDVYCEAHSELLGPVICPRQIPCYSVGQICLLAASKEGSRGKEFVDSLQVLWNGCGSVYCRQSHVYAGLYPVAGSNLHSVQSPTTVKSICIYINK